MLDSIFGSEKEEKIEQLKSELEEKEKELRELEKELKKERDRAKDAITEKQETDKELKDAKHKIETLEDKIDKLEKDSEKDKISKKVKFLKRSELDSFIQQFQTIKSESKSLVTHYIENREEVKNHEFANLFQGLDSETGYVYLKDNFELINCVLIPPVPVEAEFYREEEFRLEKLHNKLESEFRIGFISAHAGKSIVGLLEGSKFTSFNLIKSTVKGKHSKGGFSQDRFERGREKQIETHLEKIVEETEKAFEEMDYIFLDGNQEMTSKLRDELSFDSQFIEKSLDISKVSKDQREEYAEKILGARLYIF